VKARTLAGYSESYAKSASGTLWEKADIESLKDILPADSKNIGDELKKWLELMAKWRKALSKVDDPTKLGSRTFAVVASYIERLAKIFGLIIDRQERRELQVKVEEKRQVLHFESPEDEYCFRWEAIRTLNDRLEQIDIPEERKRAIEAELGFEEKRGKSEDKPK
jgi:hypothetical protein